jgi:uncharacterized FlgJ-related protein
MIDSIKSSLTWLSSKNPKPLTKVEALHEERKKELFTFLDDLCKNRALGNQQEDFNDLKTKIENNQDFFLYFDRLVDFIKSEGRPINEDIEYVLNFFNKKSFKEKSQKDLSDYRKIRLPNYDKINGLNGQKYFIFYWKDESDFGIKHFQLRIGEEDIEL